MTTDNTEDAGENGGKPEPDLRDSGARASSEKPTLAEQQSETRELKKIAFLAAFASCGMITKAAAAVGMNPDTHYEWRKTDPEYDKAFADLRVRVADLIEDEAVSRGVHGWEEPVFGRVARDQDGQIGTVLKKSDRLLEILLKGNRPERYRERFEHSGPDGGPIETRAILSEVERAAGVAALLETARARAAGQAAPGEGEVGASPGPADDSGEHRGV